MSAIESWAKGVWSDKFKRVLIIILVLIGLFLLFFNPSSQSGNVGVGSGDGELVVHYFFSPTCPHCAEQKIFNSALMEKYPEVTWIYHDVTDSREVSLFLEYVDNYGIPRQGLGVPGTFFGDYSSIGFDSPSGRGIEIENALKEFISKNNVDEEDSEEGSVVKNAVSEDKDLRVDVPFLGEIDPLSYSLPMLAVVLGLVDGFNPCAMWVLVYLISIIVVLDDKRKIWLLVGSFVFASGALYFLFMTAWLNVFLLIGYMKGLTIAIGLFALGIGINDLKSYFSGEGLNCNIGEAEGKKKTMGKMQEIVNSPLTWLTFLGIIGLAFVVNSIEFACSAAIPAIFTQVLTLSGLSGLEYYGYILLYDIFFMLDDLIIFGLAAFAVTGTAIGQRYVKHCKLIGGVVLVVLGFVMAFFPEILGRIG